MKITKQYETPKPPLATGITIELDMGEAHQLLVAFDYVEGSLLGPSLGALMTRQTLREKLRAAVEGRING